MAYGAGAGRAAGGEGAGGAPAVHVTEQGLPDWLRPVAEAARTIEPHQLSRFLPPKNGSGRQSAVLVLFGEGTAAAQTGEPARTGARAADPVRPGSPANPHAPGGLHAPGGPELLLMERAGTLRSHAGQPSFPGGALDPEDGDPAGDGPLRAALREAEEETGLDPSGVQLFGVLPRLYIPVSEFVVTPVLGWWRRPSPVAPVDPAETARVFTVPVAELTDPANRALALHPSGHRGPAFLVGGALVWGFTAGVIDRILHFAGWERPWDRDRHVPLDWRA
ncbi:NUDIX hydrolase [Streptomyces sp. 796.1]|uniref:NUDIX hydrolase n=1 Tax=Streptomyces sp. 796.1 TaxID=3163029 RepID=UPI0039C9CC3D